MIRLAVAMAAALAVLAAAAMWWPGDPAPPPAVAAPVAADTAEGPPPVLAPAAPVLVSEVPPAPSPAPSDARPAPGVDAVIAPRVRPAAAESLRRARRDGDPRTPPVAPREPRVPPPQEVLDDPELYSRYEQGERMAVYASFMAASQRRIGELEALVAQGERDGLPPEQLAEGRRKLEGLKARRQELLSRFPGLAPTD
ncbi:hypothetical protein ACLD02_06925 [Alloalcanivorax sp. C16-2]|uniref:hypothetical protein n=1 Tax=Alloalcanivorax sp. C16-2 TaxID=3390052 RepID=UPI003970AB38